MLAWPGATDGQVNTPPLLRAAPLLGSRSPSNRCRCDCFFQGEREDVTCREDSIELVLDGQDQFCQTVQDGKNGPAPDRMGPRRRLSLLQQQRLLLATVRTAVPPQRAETFGGCTQRALERGRREASATSLFFYPRLLILSFKVLKCNSYFRIALLSPKIADGFFEPQLCTK